MKRAACLVVLFCVAISQSVGVAGPAQASFKDKSFMVYGPSADTSCGKFTTVKGLEHDLYQWWALGFVSGASVFWRVPLAETDGQGILGWIDKYCAEHPLNYLTDAATALVGELAERELARSTKALEPPEK